MPRPPSRSIPYVEPAEPAPGDAGRTAVRLLVDLGWDASDASWLADLLLGVLPGASRDASILSEATSGHLLLLGMTRKHFAHGDRDAALLIILAVMTGAIWIPRIIAPSTKPDDTGDVWSLPEPERARVVQLMLAYGADFSRVLQHGWPQQIVKEWDRNAEAGSGEDASAFMRLLLLTGAIDLSKVLDLDALRKLGQAGRWWPANFSIGPEGFRWSDGTHQFDARSIRVWVRHAGLESIVRLRDVLGAEPDESLAWLVTAIAEAATSRYANSEYGCRYEVFEGLTPTWKPRLLAFGRVMRICFDEVDRRIVRLAGNAPRELRSVWMLLFRMAWDSEPTACPPVVRKRVLEAATEDLSRMRTLLDAAGMADSGAAEAFKNSFGHFDRCGMLLAQHGGLWRALKPLLLGLRKLTVPAVARDLRHWDEFADDPPPQPWSAVPSLLSGYLHAYAGREEASDPGLRRLREQIAEHLLERLRDRRTGKQREMAASNGQVLTDAEMCEPSAEWRYCSVRAVADLRVNPGGKGHRTLYWSSQHDPSPDVREAAHSTYQLLRHDEGLPAEASARRAVMSAFWWLKQAHLLGLGIQPDADGAQRTRAKELTRTKEVERQKPAAD